MSILLKRTGGKHRLGLLVRSVEHFTAMSSGRVSVASSKAFLTSNKQLSRNASGSVLDNAPVTVCRGKPSWSASEAAAGNLGSDGSSNAMSSFVQDWLSMARFVPADAIATPPAAMAVQRSLGLHVELC